MSRHRSAHRVTVAKRNLHGVRLWWATCTCKKWFNGFHDKHEAQDFAEKHRIQQNCPE